MTSNTFNSLRLAHLSPYELVFGRKPKLLLDIHSGSSVKISSTFKDYYEFLNKRLQYLHKLLKIQKLKKLPYKQG